MTLEILTADNLSSTRHGFFTRRGGASSGVFEGLNCGASSSDLCEAVRLNRERVAEAMGVGPRELVTVHQVHGTNVVAVDKPGSVALPDADALVTNRPGVALGILTADCQPVLFADAKAGVIGAAHAGWRGAMEGVLEATVDAMEALGAEAGRITVAIGPTISQRAYEVGAEFLEEFLAEDARNARFFINGAADHYQFDLPAYGLQRLRARGVSDAAWTRHCTYTDEARFYSYRRSVHRKEADYGRLISTIVL